MNELRNALLGRLNSLNLGKLYAYERYVSKAKDLHDLYVHEGRLQGGFIRRPTAKVTPGGSLGNRTRQDFELTLLRAFDDAGESELHFDNQLDSAIADFTNNHRLDGWSCAVGDRLGFELVKNSPAMFAGVLVHYAVLRISFSR